MRNHRLVRVGLLASVAVTGCDSTQSGNGQQPGELGRGTFTYTCGPGADAQCNQNADLAIVDPSTNLPPIALGSTFDLGYSNGATQADDTAGIVLDQAVNLYGAAQTGYVAVFGLRGSGSSAPAEDLVHLKIVSVDHLEFAQTSPSGGTFKGVVTAPGITVNVTVGSGTPTQLLRVVPMTSDRKLIAGALPCNWTSNDPTIAQVASDPGQNIVTVKLLKAGTTKVHVTLGSLAGDVTVTGS